MKKTRIIAVILVMVIAAGSFTGCFSYALMTSEGGGGELIFFTIPLDLVTLPFQLIYLIVTKAQEAQRNKRGKLLDGVDTFSHTGNSLPKADISSMTRTINSLPKAEIDSLTQRFNSLPEAEIASYTRRVNSFSETEINATLAAFNGLSEAEIISSIETLNSMPEEKLISMMNDLQRIRFREQN